MYPHNTNLLSVDDMRALAARSDYGYGYLIIIVLLLCVAYAVLKRVLPGITRLNVPFWLPAPLKNDSAPAWITFFVGLGLRIPHLFENLWYDETFTAAFARLPLHKLPAAIMGDVHPPLPTLVQWFSGRVLGYSEIALRLPALFFGMLSIYLIYRLAHALRLGYRTAITAAFLVAMMPAAIYYANEARGYSLLTCLVLAALICILENRPRLFVVCAGLIPWVHNTSYIYLGLFVVLALWYRPRRRWWIAAGAAGLIGAAWLPGTLQQAGDIANGFWIPPLTLPGSLWYVMADTAGVNMPDVFVLPVYIPLWSITMLALWHMKTWLFSKRGALYLGLVIGAPALLSAACWLWRPVYVSRALLPSGLALAICWAWYINHKSKNGWWLTGVALVLSSIGILVDNKEPIRQYLDCSPAQTVYYTDNVAWFYGNYYVDLPALVWDQTNDLNQSLSDEMKSVLFQQGDETNLQGTVCIVQVDTPYSTQQERDYINDLTARYPHTTRHTEFNGVFHLNVYLVEIS